jgi:uncharacterized Zn finger protein
MVEIGKATIRLLGGKMSVRVVTDKGILLRCDECGAKLGYWVEGLIKEGETPKFRCVKCGEN